MSLPHRGPCKQLISGSRSHRFITILVGRTRVQLGLSQMGFRSVSWQRLEPQSWFESWHLVVIERLVYVVECTPNEECKLVGGLFYDIHWDATLAALKSFPMARAG